MKIPDTDLDLFPSVRYLLQHTCRLSVIQPSEATPAIHRLDWSSGPLVKVCRRGILRS